MQTNVSVCENPDETLFQVFDIILISELAFMMHSSMFQ